MAGNSERAAARHCGYTVRIRRRCEIALLLGKWEATFSFALAFSFLKPEDSVCILYFCMRTTGVISPSKLTSVQASSCESVAHIQELLCFEVGSNFNVIKGRTKRIPRERMAVAAVRKRSCARTLRKAIGQNAMKARNGTTAEKCRNTTKATRISTKSIAVGRARPSCAANVKAKPRVDAAAQREVMKTKTRKRPKNPLRLKIKRNNGRLQGGGN
ncbi:unnamed protein product [Amoebophrya sp. A120]|nr:unnamed protein product [Amoebophrya sp. A120]|eukprot:GSA120T00003295001.1